ncbi:MAG: hypothetical protein NC102_04825 [Clostridium sp.]|nr:hypothetical protein [Clostridium sp.]
MKLLNLGNYHYNLKHNCRIRLTVLNFHSQCYMLKSSLNYMPMLHIRFLMTRHNFRCKCCRILNEQNPCSCYHIHWDYWAHLHHMMTKS